MTEIISTFVHICIFFPPTIGTIICSSKPDLVDFERGAFVAHGHGTEHHLSQHDHVGGAPGTLEAQTLLLGVFDFRGARGGAVQRAAAAPGGAELAAFPKHFHLALRVLRDKTKNANFFGNVQTFNLIHPRKQTNGAM